MLEATKDQALSDCLTRNPIEAICKAETLVKSFIEEEINLLSKWPSIDEVAPNQDTTVTLRWVPCLFREHYRGVTGTKMHLLWVTEFGGKTIAVTRLYDGAFAIPYILRKITRDEYPESMQVFMMERYKPCNLFEISGKPQSSCQATMLGSIEVGHAVDVCYKKNTYEIVCTEMGKASWQTLPIDDDELCSDDLTQKKLDELAISMGDKMIRDACNNIGLPVCIELTAAKDKEAETHMSLEAALRDMENNREVSREFYFQLQITDIEHQDTGKWHGAWNKNQISWVVYGAPPISAYFQTVKGHTLLKDIISGVLLPEALKDPGCTEVHAKLYAKAYSDGSIVLDDYNKFIPHGEYGIPKDVLTQKYQAYKVKFNREGNTLKTTLYGIDRTISRRDIVLSHTTYTYSPDFGEIDYETHSGSLLLHMLYRSDAIELFTLFTHMLRKRSGTVTLEGSLAPLNVLYRNFSTNFKLSLAL